MTAVMEHKPATPMVFTVNPLLPVGQVEQSKSNLAPIKHIQLQLTSARLRIADADACGSILLGSLPDRNHIFIGGEANLSCVKDGTGILSSEQPKLAVGSAA